MKGAENIQPKNAAKGNQTEKAQPAEGAIPDYPFVPFIQPKLTIGAPDDPYEKEADAMADTVMRMPEQNFVQRKCAACMQEEQVQKKQAPLTESITPVVQRSLRVPNPDEVPADVPATDISRTIPVATKIAHFTSIVQNLCPSFTVAPSGSVVPTANPAPVSSALATGANPVGCCGINILVNGRDGKGGQDWKIEMSQLKGPSTRFGTTTFVLPPPNSALTFGDFTAAGNRVDINDTIVAGHEIVGHGVQEELDIHNQGDEDRESFNHHDPTVRIQNILQHEQGLPASMDRGLAASGVHRGESFGKVEIDNFALNSSSVAALPAAELDKLALAADFISKNQVLVDVIGHSDSSGSATAKQQISDDRANAVKQKLLTLGVTPTVLMDRLPTFTFNGNRFTRVAGVSDHQPPVTGAANPANWRRVEIFMVGHPAGAEIPPALPALGAATPGASLAAEQASPEPCHKLFANSAFPAPAAAPAVPVPAVPAPAAPVAPVAPAAPVAPVAPAAPAVVRPKLEPGLVQRRGNHPEEPDLIQRDERDDPPSPGHLQLPHWNEIQDPSRADHLKLNEGLTFRGVPFATSYAGEEDLEFNRQYEFYKEYGFGHIVQNLEKVPLFGHLVPHLAGFDPDAALANKTVPISVGNALNRDYPSLQERNDAPATIPIWSTSHNLLDGSFMQRKCAECEKEAQLQRKGEKEVPVLPDITAQSIESSKGGGTAMDTTTESFMSSRFGADFSDVRIHANSEAAQINRSINAKAFTTGKDVYFNEGQYQPASDSGKHLLAHELTHTLQQGNGLQ